MAIRYTAAFLLHLRESPLCTRPDNLPPAEEWMGTTPEQLRAQSRATGDKPRATDNPLLDQPTTPPAGPPLIVLATAPVNPDDIVFGPPRMAFSSARGNKALENEKVPKEPEALGRPSLRGRNGDADGDRLRDIRSTHLRRSDADQDGDGWSTVKPRKSFGTEGAERFHGKMGGNFRDERRPAKDKDERDATRDRPARSFDTFVRDKDPTDGDGRSRNGIGRNKLDPWRSSDVKDSPQPERRDRDRTKSWRDRDKEAEPSSDDRGNGRTSDRRWGRERDHKSEREPEWLDEPHVEQREAHTQQDFQKWMEQMKATKSGGSAPSKPAAAPAPEAVAEVPKRSAPAPVEVGPDKFFMAFGGGSNAALDVTCPSEPKEVPSKAKPAAKSSRFTSFFSQPQQDGRVKSDASTPLAGPPTNGPALSAGAAMASAPAPEEERQAFQQLLAKLQKQSMSATPPGLSPFVPPPQSGLPTDVGKKSAIASPEPFHQYGGERRDGPLRAPLSQHPHEILAPRPQQQSARPDQLLQDLVGHHQRVCSQGSLRPEVNLARNNSNTEFLMNLMRAAPDLQRAEHQTRAQQPQKPGAMTPFTERETEFLVRENRGAQRQMRPQPPPGFPIDEPFHGADQEQRQSQPTQILQRPPPPPGLEQMPPENVPLPHMFAPNFPPAGVPLPDGMRAMPPRNLPMPPPGFFNGPPHGFVPPGLGGFNGPPGPESHMFGGSPFEGRGIPPPSGRGASFSRP
ncbi:hypothetical protein OCS_01319 [Ophiocordyceps sinensis CO18]|uniref:Uncharacterized protein n=1 Tax=Ophiocordyceps sinensis (strain Co18 / CGMCC 3.14243) TaxID=911162 RepID=T5AM92_OPHSC|nr:hypothetical protein OCS_01319 [Ophiocordyceps sinensis CO18]